MEATGHRRRGGGPRARRERPADLPPGHAAEHQMGSALRRHPLQCPGDGRVRRRVGRLGQDPRADQHAAAARGDSLQRVCVPGRVRRGVAARLARARDADSEGDRRTPCAARGRRGRPARSSKNGHRRPPRNQGLRQLHGRQGRELLGGGRRARRPARPVGVGQDHAAPDHRRARAGRCRHGDARRGGRDGNRRARSRPSASSSSTTRSSAT